MWQGSSTKGSSTTRKLLIQDKKASKSNKTQVHPIDPFNPIPLNPTTVATGGTINSQKAHADVSMPLIYLYGVARRSL